MPPPPGVPRRTHSSKVSKLVANQNRIIDGMKIMGDGVLVGIARWRLEIDSSATAWKIGPGGFRDLLTGDRASA